MRSKLFASVTIAAAIASMALVQVPSFAQKSATATSVKIGYFNLGLVKASYPESAGSESLKTQAENQLRRDVEEGNKRLIKAQEEKKEKAEIEKMARDMQAEINAKQQALIQLVQTQNAIATQNIAAAVQGVAKEKGLDIIVDANAVYSGGDKVVGSGEDITDAVIKKLNPSNTVKAPSTASSGSSK